MTASALFFAPFVCPFRFQIYCLALSFRNADMFCPLISPNPALPSLSTLAVFLF